MSVKKLRAANRRLKALVIAGDKKLAELEKNHSGSSKVLHLKKMLADLKSNQEDIEATLIGVFEAIQISGEEVELPSYVLEQINDDVARFESNLKELVGPLPVIEKDDLDDVFAKILAASKEFEVNNKVEEVFSKQTEINESNLITDELLQDLDEAMDTSSLDEGLLHLKNKNQPTQETAKNQTLDELLAEISQELESDKKSFYDNEEESNSIKEKPAEAFVDKDLNEISAQLDEINKINIDNSASKNSYATSPVNTSGIKATEENISREELNKQLDELDQMTQGIDELAQKDKHDASLNANEIDPAAELIKAINEENAASVKEEINASHKDEVGIENIEPPKVASVKSKEEKKAETLAHAVNEFYATEETFHERMQALVKHFYDGDKLRDSTSFMKEGQTLSQDQQRLLEVYLAPYRAMRENPFKDKPVETEAALEKIIYTVNKSSTFKAMQKAAVLSAMQLTDFKDFTASLKGQFQEVEFANQKISPVSDFTINPVQRFTRYPLLLSEISKNYPENGVLATPTKTTLDESKQISLLMNEKIEKPSVSSRKRARTLAEMELKTLKQLIGNFSIDDFEKNLAANLDAKQLSELKNAINQLKEYGLAQPDDKIGLARANNVAIALSQIEREKSPAEIASRIRHFVNTDKSLHVHRHAFHMTQKFQTTLVSHLYRIANILQPAKALDSGVPKPYVRQVDSYLHLIKSIENMLTYVPYSKGDRHKLEKMREDCIYMRNKLSKYAEYLQNKSEMQPLTAKEKDRLEKINESNALKRLDDLINKKLLNLANLPEKEAYFSEQTFVVDKSEVEAKVNQLLKADERIDGGSLEAKNNEENIKIADPTDDKKARINYTHMVTNKHNIHMVSVQYNDKDTYRMDFHFGSEKNKSLRSSRVFEFLHTLPDKHLLKWALTDLQNFQSRNPYPGSKPQFVGHLPRNYLKALALAGAHLGIEIDFSKYKNQKMQPSTRQRKAFAKMLARHESYFFEHSPEGKGDVLGEKNKEKLRKDIQHDSLKPKNNGVK